MSTRPKLTPGQKRLLHALVISRRARLAPLCDEIGCTTTDAYALEQAGLIVIEDDETDNVDAHPFASLTDAGRQATEPRR